MIRATGVLLIIISLVLAIPMLRTLVDDVLLILQGFGVKIANVDGSSKPVAYWFGQMAFDLLVLAGVAALFYAGLKLVRTKPIEKSS